MASISLLLSQDETISIQELNYAKDISTPRSVEHQAKMLGYNLIKERTRGGAEIMSLGNLENLVSLGRRYRQLSARHPP